MVTLDRWLKTWNGLGIPSSSPLRTLYAELIARYSEPHRHYHTVRHLSECFDRWALLRDFAPHPGEVEVALWFHDVIYDTHRDDNEAKSAKLAEKSAIDLGVRPDSARCIRSLILCTHHVVEPVGPDEEALVDTDLSILGASPSRFAEYERQVRLEYAWVPEPAYRSRRSALLNAFLTRPHIYATDLFRERYEAQARANLQQSLENLR
jgi:predicted metal-dependent HD superfamily phosphohydrolase